MKKLVFVLAVSMIVLIPAVTGCFYVSIIENVTWVMESYGNSEALDDVEITLYFDSSEGEFTGNAGINTYSGKYQLIGTTINFPEGYVKTVMAGNEETMQQEEEYLLMFVTADSIEMVRGKLHITSDDGVIIYKKK